MPRHIGIVACVEGEQLMGPHDHPEVSMHTHSLGESMKCINAGDWDGVGDLAKTDEREEINRIIFDELVSGVFKPESIAYFERVITRLKDEGCDSVILGCTEIPLIIRDANSALPKRHPRFRNVG